MSDRCIRLHGLKPETALKLIADFVTREKQHRFLLDEPGVSVRTSTFGSLTGVEILVPDYYAGQGHKAQREALKVFTGYWQKVDRISCPPSGVLPLLNALPSLLLACDAESLAHGAAASAQPEYNQKLLACWPQDGSHAQSLLQKARLFSTSIRAAMAESIYGECLLIHLLNDPQRLSLFESAHIGNRFKDCVILDIYKSKRLDEDRLIALPENFTPARTAFEHFFTILAEGHKLFGHPETPGGEMLAAVVTWQERNKQKSLLIYPGEVQFRPESYFAPRTIDLASYEILLLHESKTAMSRLRESISAVSPDTGYRLRLIPSRYLEASDDESYRLRIMRDEIDERLVELSGLRPRRPTLLRFTQRDLKTFADLLRSYSVDKKDLGRLLYGFFADTEQYREGVHFLLLNHDVLPKTLPPWTDWPVKFWLDPHWAHYYHRREDQALVFVPYGTTLYPSMHSWDASEMSEYLRDILGSRYHGELGVQTIPANPIYLFDGETDDETLLHLTILDRDNFEPLSERLGWLNENLMCLDYYGDTERFISMLAATIEQDRIDSDLASRAKLSAAAFETAAMETSNHMATQTQHLVEGVSAGIDAILTNLENFIERAEVINRDLAALETLYKDMKAWTERTKSLQERTLTQATEALEQHTHGISAQVEDAITKASAQRRKLEADLAKTTTELQAARVRLRNRIQSLHENGNRYE